MSRGSGAMAIRKPPAKGVWQAVSVQQIIDCPLGAAGLTAAATGAPAATAVAGHGHGLGNHLADANLHVLLDLDRHADGVRLGPLLRLVHVLAHLHATSA